MNYIYDYICIIRLIDFTVYVIFPSVWVFVQLANDKTRWTIKSEQNLGEVTHNALTVFWNETFTFWSSFQLRHIMHSTFLRNSDIFFKFLFSLFNETAHYWYYLRRSFIYWGGGVRLWPLTLSVKVNIFKLLKFLWPSIICFHTFVNVCCKTEPNSWK